MSGVFPIVSPSSRPTGNAVLQELGLVISRITRAVSTMPRMPLGEGMRAAGNSEHRLSLLFVNEENNMRDLMDQAAQQVIELVTQKTIEQLRMPAVREIIQPIIAFVIHRIFVRDLEHFLTGLLEEEMLEQLVNRIAEYEITQIAGYMREAIRTTGFGIHVEGSEIMIQQIKAAIVAMAEQIMHVVSNISALQRGVPISDLIQSQSSYPLLDR